MMSPNSGKKSRHPINSAVRSADHVTKGPVVQQIYTYVRFQKKECNNSNDLELSRQFFHNLWRFFRFSLVPSPRTPQSCVNGKDGQMTTYQECWFYQCTKPECGFLGLVNDVVLRLEYADGIVPCPYCRTPMERIRQAQPGEYDPEEQQAAADKASTTLTFRSLRPGESIIYPYMYPVIQSARPHCCPNIRDRRARGQKATEPGDDSAAPSAAQCHEPDFLTELDVAQLLGVSVKAVRKLVKDKKLGAIRPTNKKLLFTRALIDEFLQREAGVPSRPGEASNSTRSFGFNPSRSSLSLEQSRALLQDLRDKPGHHKKYDR